MNKPKIVTDGQTSINLADVKCFKVISISEMDVRKSFLVIEFKGRIEFIFNPESGKYEKQEYNDKTEIEFSEYEMATAYKRDWEYMWQEYLEEQVR
jgi:hypothetical protein